MSQFSYVLEDYSPYYVYKPYANGQGNQTQNGWVQFFSQEGFNNQGGEDGAGDSSHITSLAGATVSLQFFGTDVTLFGSCNGTYSVSLDGTQQPLGSPAARQLFSTSGLSNAVHSLTLSLTDSANSSVQLAFSGANVTSTTQSASPLQPLVVDNSNTTAIKYSGTWAQSAAHQLPEPYQLSKTSGASASLQFQGRAIAINGMTNFGWWVYQVALDGVSSNRNASSMFINPNSTLFFQDGLDETKQHTINITNVSDGMDLAITSFTVYASNDVKIGAQASNTTASNAAPTSALSSSKSSNGGAIAGAVIGVLAFVALAAGLIFWLRRRKETDHAVAYPHEDMEKYYSHPEIHVTVEDGARTVTLGHDRQRVFRGFREGKTSSSAFSPVSEDTTATDYPRGDSSSTSPSTLQATESPSSANASWHPAAGYPNEKQRALPQIPEHRTMSPVRSPPSTFGASESRSSEENVDRIANMIMERMVNRLGTMGTLPHDDHAPPPSYE